MLGDFEALRQVEPALEVLLGGEVMHDKAAGRYFQPGAIDIVAVNADNVIDTVGLPLPQPCAACAADIHDAPHRHDRSGRLR